MRESILVTGAAGFIGFHLARQLLANGWTNWYSNQKLKKARRAELSASPNFRFERCDLADRSAMTALFSKNRFIHVAHLAAQAGVAYSADNPSAYRCEPGPMPG